MKRYGVTRPADFWASVTFHFRDRVAGLYPERRQWASFSERLFIRTPIQFAGDDTLNTCELVSDTSEKLFPGTTVECECTMIIREVVEPFLYVGNTFEVWSVDFIATGVVMEVFDSP